MHGRQAARKVMSRSYGPSGSHLIAEQFDRLLKPYSVTRGSWFGPDHRPPGHAAPEHGSSQFLGAGFAIVEGGRTMRSAAAVHAGAAYF